MEVARGMPLILLDDVGAGGVVGDLAARGFGIGIEAIAPPILDLGFFFALTLPTNGQPCHIRKLLTHNG